MSLPLLQARWRKLRPENRINNRTYPVVALTGGIGSGKSTLARFFTQKGVPFISADALVKNIYSQPETRAWLAEHHACVINPDNGTPNFRMLREKAFSDPAVRQQLEGWIYPRMPAAFESAETPFRPVPWMVYEIPLLFERKMEALFDCVVVSWVPRDTQKSRVIGRDGVSEKVVDAILGQQDPIDGKRSKADIVFDNSPQRTEAEIMLAMESLWKELVETP